MARWLLCLKCSFPKICSEGHCHHSSHESPLSVLPSSPTLFLKDTLLYYINKYMRSLLNIVFLGFILSLLGVFFFTLSWRPANSKAYRSHTGKVNEWSGLVWDNLEWQTTTHSSLDSSCPLQMWTQCYRIFWFPKRWQKSSF